MGRVFPYRSRRFCQLARSWRALQNGAFPLFQTINRVPQSLQGAVRVTPRDLGVARLARRGRVARQIGDVVLDPSCAALPIRVARFDSLTVEAFVDCHFLSLLVMAAVKA